MTGYKPGDVVLVRFPFTDLSSSKKRPAVVVSPKEYAHRCGDSVILPLTSQADPNPDFAVTSWKKAGLLKPTWFKPLLGTVTNELIQTRLGALDKSDYARIGTIIKQMIAPDFFVE